MELNVAEGLRDRAVASVRRRAVHHAMARCAAGVCTAGDRPK
jgi:hypothetical protein